MSASADLLFRQLPGVADIEVRVSPPAPTHRIIHLRDWHYVPLDLFAVDVRQSAGKPLSDAEVEALYQTHLDDVERVQREQENLLGRLVEHHGLRRVVIEGLTPKGKAAYPGVLAAIAATDERLASLLREHRDVRGRDPAVDRAVEELERGHRRQLLEHGAAGRLAMRGLVEVLPLDDDGTLEKANPVTADGRVRLDPAAVEARHDAQVRAAISSGPVAVIVLGGAHDLSGAVARVGNGHIEYIRVTTSEYRRVAGGP